MEKQKGAAVGKLIGALAGTVAIVVILMWLMGAFASKEAPGDAAQVLRRLPPGTKTVVVTNEEIPVRETAVGTISPVQKVSVGSKLLARITSMKVKKAGELVEAGQVLATLDDDALTARLREAQADLQSAEAQKAQAAVELGRIKTLYEKRVESKSTLDMAETVLKTAQAAVTRSEQAVHHADAMLDYATVRAPIGGIVIDKQAEEGDLVSPGQVLVTLYDPSRMQLVARVREALALGLEPGDVVDVTIDALDLDCTGRIDQVVPEAQATSRVFEVRVSGPCPPGVFSGMFARLHIPVGTRTVLRIGAAAIHRVGQLEMVYVVLDDERILRRLIQTGPRSDRGVEVLSGLDEGERILASARDGQP